MSKLRVVILAAASSLASFAADASGQSRTATSHPVKEKRITLQTANGEISDVLRLVAEQGGLNLVVGPEVKGKVSVYLDDVPVTGALKSIAVNNGFSCRVEDAVITVSKPIEDKTPPAGPPLVTRIFTMRSQDAERVKEALEFALSKFGKMKVLNENSQGGYGVQRLSNLSGDVNGGSGSSAGGSASGSTTPGAGGAGGAASGMASGLRTTASTTEPPHNARTLVVTDIEENVDRIGQLISDLDRLPPQVLIEARIVEMSTDLQRRLGIDWNINALANGPILNHEWPLRNKAGFASGSQIMRNPDGIPQNSAGLALGSIDFSQFTLMLQAHQVDNSIRMLANPRLLVYNNHSASILVGERYPILQATITNFGTVTEAFSTYIPVGVQLEVTPTIMIDGTISMLVHPATSALGDDVVGTTGLRVARIRTRELDTRVIMSDGQTIVLGGLISDRKTHSANKVPGLGDIPVLDVLFRQENPRAERVDLLIFLTAHVDGAAEVSERDRRVYDMYKPHFKQIDRLQDVPLHFEVPTEYEVPRPMFTDPPASETIDDNDDAAEKAGHRKSHPVKQENRVKAAQAAPPQENAPSQTDSKEVSKAESANYSAIYETLSTWVREKCATLSEAARQIDAQSRDTRNLQTEAHVNTGVVADEQP